MTAAGRAGETKAGPSQGVVRVIARSVLSSAFGVWSLLSFSPGPPAAGATDSSISSVGSAAGISSVHSASSATGISSVQAFMTLYGYADNSPPGTDIAHPCIHQQAGGTGTYSDPITFATDVNELPWCEVIYVPYMERYFIHEDECSECDRDWSKLHMYRFDMWAGGDKKSIHGSERRALIRCEDTWTRGSSISDPNNPVVTLDPPPGLPVTSAPIFTPPKICWDGS